MSFGRTLRHSFRSFTFLACVVACQGEDPVLVSGSSGAPAGDGGALAPDAAPSLGCPLGCLPPAPAGWTGPSAIYDGPAETKPAACPAPYSLKELEAHQGMTAPPAVCSCGDPAFADPKCSVTVEQWSTSACGGGVPLGKAEGTVPGNTCLEKRGAGAYIKFLPGVFSATCSFPSPTTTRPDPSYERLNVACGLPQVGSCSGRPDCTATPLPDAPFGRLCIHRDGEVACPSEDYASRFLAYRGVVDERSCTPCSGKASGTCGTSPKVSSSDVCLTGNVDAQVGACQTAGSYLNIAGMGVASSACEAQGGAPSGRVTDKDPITFCCNR